MPIDSQRNIKFREIVDRYVVDRRAGKTPDKKEIAKQYPDLAKDLKREFNRIDLLLQVHDNEDAVDITRAHAVVSTNRTRSVNSSTREKFKCLTPRVRDDNSDRLQVRCPECSHAIEIVTDTSWTTITCDSCNTNFNLASTETGNEQALTMIGHFEVRERVGMGAFGTVWRAYDRELDRDVAIKIPRKGQLTEFEAEYFLREARAAAQIRHPNIVRVYEVGRHDDRVFIASDFIEGVTLDQHLADFRLTIRESAGLVSKLASALQVAHDAGVVHRDLKPGNILLDRETQPHITDFGLAKHDSGDVTMTVDGAIVGTPAYMSPEQALGNAHTADCRTDVYSLGVILFELLTGARPFRGNTRMMINQVINEEPPNPLKLNSRVDRDLATITLKCLQKEPGRRYETTEHLADDLNRYLEGKPIHARPVGVLERSWRWCKRKPALASAIAVSTLLLATLGIGGPIVAYQQSSLKKQAEESAERSADVLQIVTDSFRTANPDSGSDVKMTAKDIVINANGILSESDLDDEGRVILLNTLTKILVGLGEYKDAIETAEQDVEIRKKLQGEDHPDTLRAMNSLANVYKFAGHYPEAIKLGEKTRAAQIDILGPDHPDTLLTSNYLANAYRSSGQLIRAIRLYEKTLELRREVLREDHPHIFATMNNLSNAYRENGEYDKALARSEDTLAAMDRVTLPQDHASRLTAINNLANIYYSKRNWDSAHEMYKATLEARKRVLDADHPSTLTSMHNLALSLYSKNELEEAKKFFLKALQAREKVLVRNHPDTLATKRHLAICYLDLGQYVEALQLYENIVAAWTSQRGSNDAKTVDATIELNEAVLASVQHARELVAAAQFQTAEELLNAIMAIRKQNENTQKEILQNLVVVQMAQEKYEEARKTISTWRGSLDNKDGKQLAIAKTSLAVCFLQQGEYSKAEDTAKEALEFPELTPFDRHRCQGVLAVCLAQQNEFELGEEQVVDSFNKLTEMLEEMPPHLCWYLPRACERVVRVYEMGQKTSEAKNWKSKAKELTDQIKERNESIIYLHQAHKILGKTWAKVAPKPEDDERVLTDDELKLMRQVCVQHPKGLHFMTLGVAEFRTGNFQEAMAAARESVKRTPQETRIPHVYPGDLAILAMSYWKVGDLTNANKYRKRLSKAMKIRRFAIDYECQSFVAEVIALFESKANK